MIRRVIVCGGRNFDGKKAVVEAMDAVLMNHGDITLMHGDATGADKLANDWAIAHGVTVERYPAQWKQYGRNAGPIRNWKMAEAGADLVVAFPGGNGTQNMVSVAESYGIPVWRPLEE